MIPVTFIHVDHKKIILVYAQKTLRLGTPDLIVSEFESQSYHFYLELSTSVDNEYQYPLATHFK